MVDSQTFFLHVCVSCVLYTEFHNIFYIGFVEKFNIENFGIFRLDQLTEQAFCSQSKLKTRTVIAFV